MPSKRLIILACVLLWNVLAYGQEKVVIEGAIQIGNSENVTPTAGTIRWTGLNFEGWNGYYWAPLTSFLITEVISDTCGNDYPVVEINDQDWMGQNLRTAKYRNGENILNPSGSWAIFLGAYGWHFNDSAAFEQPYGKLYNWFAVNDARGLCPTGWHVPSDAEWTSLIDFLGGGSLSGGPLKETGYEHWQFPNVGATNGTGFTGLPGGAKSDNSTGTSFGHKINGFYWSATPVDETFSSARILGSGNANISSLNYEKGFGFSVRCLRN